MLFEARAMLHALDVAARKTEQQAMAEAERKAGQ